MPGISPRVEETSFHELVTSSYKKRKKEKYIKLNQNPPKTKALSMLANFQGILNIKFNFRLLGFLFFFMK